MTTQNDWEKRFDKKFVYQFAEPDNYSILLDAEDSLPTSSSQVKDFIRQLLADARKEVIDDIFKMRITDLPNSIRFVTKDAPDGDLVDGTTWNAILESIMMALRKEIK